MLMDIEGAIFDMDGTLINSLSVWENIWEEFGKTFLDGERFNIEDADDKAVRTMTLKNAMEYLHCKYSIGKNGNDLLITAEEIIADFYSNKVELKKGVLDYLEYCYQNKVKMCIASATDINLINIAIQHCNIKKYFIDIISCAEIGKGKDEPDIYLKALDLLGTPIEKTWVFEDSHIAIETADRLGIKTVGIYDKYNFDSDKVAKIATVYIGENETFQKLLP